MDFRKTVIIGEKVSAASDLEGEIWLLDRAEWHEDMRGKSSELREDHKGLDSDGKIND